MPRVYKKIFMNKIIKEAFNQTGCSHNDSQNQAKEKKCLHKASGGESCAFDGSYIVLNPIRNTAHLIHGGITCGAHNYESRGAWSSGSRLYRYCFTTDLNETDIVFGAGRKLRNAILQIHKDFSPAAIFVYQTCIPGMTGEDTENICNQISAEIARPVIPVIAPGFLGHKNLGNRIAGDVLLKKVIGTGSQEKTSEISINIIGEYNIAGDLWNILPLFEKIGIPIQAKITGDSDFEEITNAHNASLNLMVCSRALINIATGMKERYGIDFIEVSFFGVKNMTDALRGVVRYFHSKGKLSNAEALKKIEIIYQLECDIWENLSPYRNILKGKKAVVYSGGVKSWSMISALNDLGLEVTAAGTKKASAGDKEKIEALIGKYKMLDDTSPKSLLETIKKTGADFLIAGSRNQYLAYKEKIPYIDVNQERHVSYGGYEGAMNMAKDLCASLTSPVWKSVKQDPPWIGIGAAPEITAAPVSEKSFEKTVKKKAVEGKAVKDQK